jgi:hypothetical protein
MEIQSLINYIAEKLIEKEYFIIPKDENGGFITDAKYAILQKTGLNSSLIVELFDADTFTEKDIAEKSLNKPEEHMNIGLINSANIFRIKVYIVSNLHADMIKLFDEYSCKSAIDSKGCATVVLSLESKDIVLSRGIVYPYEKICAVLKECIKSENIEFSDEKADFDELVMQRFVEPASDCQYDNLETPITNYSTIFLGFLFIMSSACLICAVFFAMFGAESKVVSIKQLLLFSLLIGTITFNFHAIGEIVEGNFGSRKYLVIISGGYLSILLAFGLPSVIFNSFIAPSGGLLYIWHRVPDSVKRHTAAKICLSLNTIIVASFSLFLQMAELMISFVFCIGFGFLLSGCLNFNSEFIDTRRKRNFISLAQVSAAAFILIFILRLIISFY